MDEESSSNATNTLATDNSKKKAGQRKKPGKLLAAHSSGVDDSGYDSRSAESTKCCSPLLVLDTLNCVNVASFELAHTTDEVYTSSHVEASKARSSIATDNCSTSSRGRINEPQDYKPIKATEDHDKTTNPTIKQSNPDDRTLCEAIHQQKYSHSPSTPCLEDCSKGSGSGSVCHCHTLQQGELEATNKSATNPPTNSSQSNNTPRQSAPGQSTPGTSEPAGCNVIHPSQSVTSSSHIFLVVSPPPSLSPPPFASLGMNLSFCGAGFLGIYHLGAAHTLATHGRGVLLNTQHYLGASAGSLVAAVLAIRGPDLNIIKVSQALTKHTAIIKVSQALTKHTAIIKVSHALTKHSHHQGRSCTQ
jgi:hypothetical protein